MTLLLEPWPDLNRAAMAREGRGLDQSASSRRRSGRACPVVTKIILAGLTTASTMWSKRSPHLSVPEIA